MVNNRVNHEFLRKRFVPSFMLLRYVVFLRTIIILFWIFLLFFSLDGASSWSLSSISSSSKSPTTMIFMFSSSSRLDFSPSMAIGLSIYSTSSPFEVLE